MTNNLKGAGRRRFLRLRITLSLFFFITITSSVTIGSHRCPTRAGMRREGDDGVKPVRKQPIPRRYFQLLSFIVSSQILVVILGGYRLTVTMYIVSSIL